MGEKNKKKCDWFCLYCSGKGVKDQLRELGYIVELVNKDLCIECPKCSAWQLIDGKKGNV